MIRVIPKWEVRIHFKEQACETYIFYIHDNFYTNVLRKVADITFEDIKVVDEIIISSVEN